MAKAYISQNKTTAVTCPTCQTVMDGVTSIGLDKPSARVPADGDMNMCVYCGELCIYTEAATELCVATRDDILKLKEDPLFSFIMESARRARLPSSRYFNSPNKVKKDAAGTDWSGEFPTPDFK